MKVRYVLLVAAAAMLVLAPAAILGAKEKEGPKTVNISGELAGADANSIAVIVRKGEKGDKETKTIAVDAATTKVFIETDQMESVPGEGGKMREKAKIVEGKVGDLTSLTGRRVTVGCTADSSKAVKIFVQRAAPPKGNKEGGREGDAPRAPKIPKTGGEGDRKEK